MIRLRTPAALAAAVAAVAVCAGAGPADAAFDACAYDATTRTVTATFEDTGATHDATLSVGPGGALLNDGAPCDAATTSNTDSVSIAGSFGSDTVTLDQSNGAFTKPGTADELKFDVNLGEFRDCEIGDECTTIPQILRVVGTPGDDDIRAGSDAARRINLDASSDFDTDVAVTGPARLELWGGEGSDTLAGLGGAGAGAHATTVDLHGGPGDDELVAGGYNDAIYPGGGSDTIDASPSHQDVVSYADSPTGVDVDYFDFEIRDGSGSVDEFDGDVRILHGSAHDDTIKGSVGGSLLTLYGDDGDDTIVGSETADHLYGGRGADVISASSQTRDYEGDYIDGGPGNDSLRGSDGSDDIRGEGGNDRIVALRGKEDPVDGWAARGDYLVGGPGSDFVDGGSDADWYVFDPPVGREVDTIAEQPRHGRDTLLFRYSDDFEAPSTPLDTRVNLSSTRRVFGQSGSRTLRTRLPGSAWDLEDVQHFGSGDDTIVGNSHPNDIWLPYGHSTVDCRGGNDTVHGAKGSRLANCETAS